MLSSAYKSAWVYEPSLALSKDADIWEIVRNDAVIMSAMDRRLKGIVRPWHIEPPSGSKSKENKLAATICESALSKIRLFDAARRRLAMAAFLGRAYEYVEGERVLVSLADTEPMEWWIPSRLKHVDRRRFHWVSNWQASGGVRDKEVHLEMYDTNRNSWEILSPEQRSYFIEYIYLDTEDRVGYGRGLLEATYFYHFFKTQTFEKIAQGIDRWANGILVGKLDGLRNASTSKTNEDLRKAMRDVLKNMRSEHIVVLEKNDEIEVVETSGSGHEASLDFVRYLDESLERLYNGSVLPSGHAAKAGSKARAEVESDTTEEFYQADREDLDEIISRDLIGLFWRLNRANFVALGLEDAEMPRLDSEQKKREDPLMAVQVAQQLSMLGAPIVEEELYHKAGFSVPDLDDKTIGGHGALGIDGVETGDDDGKLGKKSEGEDEPAKIDKYRRNPRGTMGGGQFAPKGGIKTPQ